METLGNVSRAVQQAVLPTLRAVVLAPNAEGVMTVLEIFERTQTQERLLRYVKRQLSGTLTLNPGEEKEVTIQISKVGSDPHSTKKWKVVPNYKG